VLTEYLENCPEDSTVTVDVAQGARVARPSVSWLLCTHREDALLHRAIASCLAQTWDDFELLLVVNGPQSAHLLPTLTDTYAHDQRVRVIGTAVHLLNFSLSLGLHLARAPLVARMDADDVAHPERLARQVAFMHAHPEVTVLGTSSRLIDQQGRVVGRIDAPGADRDIRRAMRYRNPMCHPSVMLKRDPVLAIGGYLGGKNAEDYDLWVRLATSPTARFANLPEPLLDYNASPAGQARRSRAAYANVAGTQWREFLITRDPRWLLGSLITAVKSFVLANRA